jgi:hypothetical protein
MPFQEHIRNVLMTTETSQITYLQKKQSMRRREKRTLACKDIGPLQGEHQVL